MMEPSTPALGSAAIARLKSITRFPLKGFPGTALAATAVEADRGLPLDRFLGIANGQEQVRPAQWSPCQSFLRMTRNETLPCFATAYDEASQTLALTAPNGERLAIELADAASIATAEAVLARWFPWDGVRPPKIVRRDADLGWWDYEDAQISLINSETVAALSARVGQTLSPDRFRGNLLIEGLTAWREFALVGHTIAIGNALFEILRPIDRCKTTSVDPSTGRSDINLPAHLALLEGHMFFGVHCRVLKPGVLQPGQELRIAGRAERAFIAGSENATAPEPAKWPRPMDVTAREVESEDTISLWLRDPAGALARPVPGQHIRIHRPDESAVPSWRSYTVSAIEGDRLRVSVKLVDYTGSFSHHLHRFVRVGDTLLASGPFGEMRLRDGSRPIVMISAGVGITPMAAMLRHLSSRPDGRRVFLVHGARDMRHAPLWREAEAFLGKIPEAQGQLHLSAGDPPEGAAKGRIDRRALANLPLAEADIFICGPSGFMDDVRSLAIAAGADVGRIRFEAFASPSVAGTARREIEDPGPFRVSFARSGVETKWSARTGTVLELGESMGLALPSNCRAGVCGSCRCRVLSGTALNLVDPPFPLAEKEILACMAVPTSDLVVEA